MRTTFIHLLTTAAKIMPAAIAAPLVLPSAASAEEPIPRRIVWQNGAYDTIQFSGSLTTTHASGDDFRLERETVIGSLTLWGHDLGSVDAGGPVGDLDELDTIAETLSVAFYSDGSGVPGTFIATREIENAELCDTGALAPNDEHIFQIDGVFTEPLQLPAGDYWFIVRNGAWGSPAGGPTNMVIRGTQTQTMTAAVTSSEPTDPGGWTDETNTGDLAFQLHATPGFIGHEVAVYGKYYDANNSQQRFGPPFLLGVERVGDGVEFEPFDGPNVGSGGFDFEAFTIDIDESNLAERNFVNAAGNFNGYTIEDTNGTLPDFVSATIDETVSTRTTPDLLVTPNTIWVNDESHTYEPNAFLRINVRFADRVSDPAPAIVPVLDGLFLLEAPAEVGRRHRFERSTDLTTWTPFDVLYVADSPFATTLVGPAGATSHFRLRRSN